jgi:cell division protein FtsB
VSPLTLRRLALTLIPMLFLASVVVMAIFGDTGLVRRHELRQELYRVEEHASTLRESTSDMRRELALIQTEELGLRRLAARELRMAPKGSTLYVFDR